MCLIPAEASKLDNNVGVADHENIVVSVLLQSCISFCRFLPVHAGSMVVSAPRGMMLKSMLVGEFVSQVLRLWK